MKTLELNLGLIQPQQAQPQEYSEGWYVDPQTGQPVYYNPETRNFYTLAGGIYIPLGYMNTAPKQVSLTIGDKLKVSISYKYSGPAITGALERFCVGVYGSFGFTEQLVGEITRNLPASSSLQTYTDSYTFTIPSNVGSDWDDIYCKIYGGSPGVPQTLFGYENALIIAGLSPTISGFTITDFAKV
jgi:hypothetical protein